MTAASPLLLAVDGLAMRFGAHVLFEALSFSFGPGAVALLGGNGTGKSSLMSLLAGITVPQAGTIRVAGHDMALQPRRAKAHLAYVPDDCVAYEFMTGADFLALVESLRGAARTGETHGSDAALIAGLGLEPYLDTRFELMSLGTRKKFMLASGLMSRAAVVLMDEPTNGIDAQARQFLIALIRRDQAGRLFFFSTHDRELTEDSGAQRLHLTAT